MKRIVMAGILTFALTPTIAGAASWGGPGTSDPDVFGPGPGGYSPPGMDDFHGPKETTSGRKCPKRPNAIFDFGDPKPLFGIGKDGVKDRHSYYRPTNRETQWRQFFEDNCKKVVVIPEPERPVDPTDPDPGVDPTDPINPVPLPASMLLMLAGLGSFAVLRRRYK